MSNQQLRLKRSGTPGKRPTLSDLQLGEIALNTYDGDLFAIKDTSGVGIATTVTNLTPWNENFGGTKIEYPNDVSIGGSAKVSGILTASAFSGNGSNLTGLTAGQVGALAGISVREEGFVVGTAGSVGDVNFVGKNVTVTASGIGATVTISDSTVVTNVLYVTADGNDNNSGRSLNDAKRTVGAALTLASASTTIKVFSGNYSENNPLIMPEQVSIVGDSLREVSLIPQNANADFIYVGQGNYISDVSFTGTLNEGKAVIAFNPNKPSFVNQGPYIRNCTNFVANSIGMKIDGNAVIGDTKAMNVDSYTQYNQGGIGVSISNNGYAQLVSIFTICNDQSIVCVSGGQCDLTNSNSSFGRLGLVADGVGAQSFIGTVTTNAAADSDSFTINVDTPTLNVNNAVYDNTVGLVTITTSTNHNFNAGQEVEIRNLLFECTPGGSTATFPSGNYGNIFTVNATEASNQFSAYIGVSTLSHTYVSSGIVSSFVPRPYDGLVTYFDEVYNTISEVVITNGGSGYGNTPPTVTFDAPSESWGITATGVARLTNGIVTGVDIVSSGRGYTSQPSVTFSAPNSGSTATGTATTLPTYYVINSATPIVSGITTITLSEEVPFSVGTGATAHFFQQSKILASSHAFEYIGSGNNISQAIPRRGGVAVQENEIKNLNGGLVVFTSTDQAGNFRIGEGVVINQQDGSISGDAYQRSLFANITPYILALGGNI